MEQQSHPETSDKCRCAISTADITTLQDLSLVSVTFMNEVHKLHSLLKTVSRTSENQEYQKSQLHELIQKKFALLHTVDSLRADVLDPSDDDEEEDDNEDEEQHHTES
jgi:hypothetical protein